MRVPVSLVLMCSWHRQIMDGLDAPNPNWIGVVRGSSEDTLINVRVGAHLGMPFGVVGDAVDQFIAELNAHLIVMDRAIPAKAELSANQLDAVLRLCAWAHAKWVRIHPFINGNGRTARLWANFIAMRYGIPPFVTLRPRPGSDAYTAAAIAALRDDDWTASVPMMHDLYFAYVRSL